MADDYQDDPFRAQISQMIDALMKDGVAGGTISADGVTMGMPNWEERTKDQRFAEKWKTHGYPLGLAKSARATQARRSAELKDRVIAMSVEERAEFDAAFEALAYAIDAQRFLGNYNPRDRSSFDKDLVDTIAENMITWLAERGHRIAPVDAAAWYAVGGVSGPAAHQSTRKEMERSLLSDDVIARLSDMPLDVETARSEATARIDQRLSRWEHLRYSQRQRQGGTWYFLFVPAKLHRQQLIHKYRTQIESFRGEDRAAYRASHAALAYAIDAERFLKSVPADDLTGDKDVEEVNRFANRLLAWLDDYGYQLVPKQSDRGSSSQ